MPSTRDIRRRIKSVKNTAQITKAMQLVAAAKMKKAQDQATNGRAYAERAYDIRLTTDRFERVFEAAVRRAAA